MSLSVGDSSNKMITVSNVTEHHRFFVRLAGTASRRKRRGPAGGKRLEKCEESYDLRDAAGLQPPALWLVNILTLHLSHTAAASYTLNHPGVFSPSTIRNSHNANLHTFKGQSAICVLDNHSRYWAGFCATKESA